MISLLRRAPKPSAPPNSWSINSVKGLRLGCVAHFALATLRGWIGWLAS